MCLEKFLIFPQGVQPGRAKEAAGALLRVSALLSRTLPPWGIRRRFHVGSLHPSMEEAGCASEELSNEGPVCRLQRAALGVAEPKEEGDSPVGGSLSAEAHLSLPGSPCPSLLNSRQMTRGESQAALLKLPTFNLGGINTQNSHCSARVPQPQDLFLQQFSREGSRCGEGEWKEYLFTSICCDLPLLRNGFILFLAQL